MSKPTLWLCSSATQEHEPGLTGTICTRCGRRSSGGSRRPVPLPGSDAMAPCRQVPEGGLLPPVPRYNGSRHSSGGLAAARCDGACFQPLAHWKGRLLRPGRGSKRGRARVYARAFRRAAAFRKNASLCRGEESAAIVTSFRETG